MTSTKIVYAMSGGGKDSIFYQNSKNEKLVTQRQVIEYLSKQKETKHWENKQSVLTQYIFVPIGCKTATPSVIKKCPNAKVLCLEHLLNEKNKIIKKNKKEEEKKKENEEEQEGEEEEEYEINEIEMGPGVFTFRLHMEDEEFNVYSQLPVNVDFFTEEKFEESKNSCSLHFGTFKSSNLSTLLFHVPFKHAKKIRAMDICDDCDVLAMKMFHRPLDGTNFKLSVSYQTNSKQHITALQFMLSWKPLQHHTTPIVKKQPRFDVNINNNGNVNLKIYCFDGHELEFGNWFPYLLEHGPIIELYPSQTTITIPFEYLEQAIATLEKKGYKRSNKI